MVSGFAVCSIVEALHFDSGDFRLIKGVAACVTMASGLRRASQSFLALSIKGITTGMTRLSVYLYALSDRGYETHDSKKPSRGTS
jgi:hypothetical protein